MITPDMTLAGQDVVSAGDSGQHTFLGVIRETLRREVPIVAKDAEEARRKLEELYRSGSVVLTADDFLKSVMKIYPTGNQDNMKGEAEHETARKSGDGMRTAA